MPNLLSLILVLWFSVSALDGQSYTPPASLGSGSLASFIAGANIEKGSLVSLSSSYTVNPGLPIAYGPFTPIGTTAITVNQYNVASLGSSFVILYNDTGNSGKLTAIVGAQSGSPVATVTFGAPVLLPSSSAGGSTSALLVSQNVAALGSSKFVVTYRDSTDSAHLYSAVASVSESAITFGAAVLVPTSTGTGSTSTSCITQDLDSSHFAVGFVDSTNGNDITAAAASVSGTAITWGTQVAPTISSQVPFGNYPLIALGSSALALFTGNTSGLYTIVGAVSGTTITFGSAVELSTGPASIAPYEFALGASGSFAVTFVDASVTPNKYVSVVCSTSGTTITKGTEAQLPSFSGNVIQTQTSYIAQDLDASHFGVLYSDFTNGNKLSLAIASVSGTAITWGAANVVMPGTPAATFTMAALDATHLFLMFTYTPTSNTWQSAVAQVSGTNVVFSPIIGVDYPTIISTTTLFLPAIDATQVVLTDASYNFAIGTYQGLWAPIGIATANASLSGSVPVLFSGIAAGLYSALTPGAAYYAQGDGSINAQPTSVPVGIALNTTDLLVRPSR